MSKLVTLMAVLTVTAIFGIATAVSGMVWDMGSEVPLERCVPKRVEYCLQVKAGTSDSQVLHPTFNPQEAGKNE